MGWLHPHSTGVSSERYAVLTWLIRRARHLQHIL